MRNLLAIPAALALLSTQACTHAQTPAPWLLTFDGKSTNELALDKRFPAFLHTHITTRKITYWINKPTEPAKDAMEFLHGPPDDVHAADHRYVTASACVAHDATDCGLLWVDTKTGATIFAAKIFRIPPPIATNSAHLWLFTNTKLNPKALPPTFTAAIATWSAATNGDNTHTLITDITLVQPSGTQLRLSRDDVHTWQPAPNPSAATPAGK